MSGKLQLGPALALEIHDYQWCEASEASQWGLSKSAWETLEQTCSALADLAVLALAHAVEAMFADREQPADLDSLMARHFRLRQ